MSTKIVLGRHNPKAIDGLKKIKDREKRNMSKGQFNLKEAIGVVIVHPHDPGKVFASATLAIEALKANWAEQMPIFDTIDKADVGEGKPYAEAFIVDGVQRAATWDDLKYFDILNGLAQNANPPGTPDGE